MSSFVGGGRRGPGEGGLPLYTWVGQFVGFCVGEVVAGLSSSRGRVGNLKIGVSVGFWRSIDVLCML